MPIRQTTPQSQIDAYIEERMNRLKEAIIYNLCVIGEKVRNEAIDSGSYKDRTKNLRSSVGYIVVVDGQVHKTGAFGKSDGNSEGKSTGCPMPVHWRGSSRKESCLSSSPECATPRMCPQRAITYLTARNCLPTGWCRKCCGNSDSNNRNYGKDIETGSRRHLPASERQHPFFDDFR